MLLVTPKELRSVRKAIGLTQGELAHLANTSQVHISRIETGTQEPTLNMMERITKALQLEPEKRIMTYEVQTGEPVEVEIYESFEIVGKNGIIYRLLKTKNEYLVANTGRRI